MGTAREQFREHFVETVADLIVGQVHITAGDAAMSTEAVDQPNLDLPHIEVADSLSGNHKENFRHLIVRASDQSRGRE